MRASFTPRPRELSLTELDAIECRLRSGIEPTLEEGRRLTVTVRNALAALRQETSRIGEWVSDGCPGVIVAQAVGGAPDRVPVLPSGRRGA